MMKQLIFIAAIMGVINVSAEDSFKKPELAILKKQLSKEQYACTQENGTEAPFKNKYWDNKEDGIYVDLISGDPLFSSLDKYDSGSGWPSFTKPLATEVVKQKADNTLGMKRIEVRSSKADSHLGHVFDDGPGPQGLRFCINSASLNFIPLAELQKKKLGKYLYLFQEKKKWEVAILAGGCFWGVQELMRKQPGVLTSDVGYTGGELKNPTYADVKKGTTKHAESVRILFDPKKTSYEKLLLYFFKIHDPTTMNRQGNDIGTQYRSEIFYLSEEQRKIAEAVKLRVQKSGKWKGTVVTQIEKAGEYSLAESDHQDYLEKDPDGYSCHFPRDIEF